MKFLSQSMALTRASIVDALNAERAINLQGAPFEVLDAAWEDDLVILSVKPGKSRYKLPLDEGLEGARIRWGRELEEGDLIKLVDPDKEHIVLQLIDSHVPQPGKIAWVFQSDFLDPLIDMWNGSMAKLAAKRLRQSKEDLEPLQPIRPLPDDYSELRERLAEVVQGAAYRCSIIIGPPGTGKSYTIGALPPYLLRRSPLNWISNGLLQPRSCAKERPGSNPTRGKAGR